MAHLQCYLLNEPLSHQSVSNTSGSHKQRGLFGAACLQTDVDAKRKPDVAR